MKFRYIPVFLSALFFTVPTFAEQAKEGVTYGGQVDEFVKDAIKNQLTISILRGDEYTEFKNASIAHFGAELATPPDNLATIATIDPRTQSGAGDERAGQTNWPVAGFDKDGKLLGMGHIPRGFIEDFLNALDKHAS